MRFLQGRTSLTHAHTHTHHPPQCPRFLSPHLQEHATARDIFSWPVFGSLIGLALALLCTAVLLSRAQAAAAAHAGKAQQQPRQQPGSGANGAARFTADAKLDLERGLDTPL
jgi:hypothetical protein